MPRYLKVFAALASILATAIAQSSVITTKNVNAGNKKNVFGGYPPPTCPPGWKMIHQWNYTEIGGSGCSCYNYVSNAVCSSP